MPVRSSESLILRTYPFQEADLVVSFLTRDQGKLRGVAKRARRPKSGFGSSLERLSHVRLFYYQKESRELVTLDSAELIRSPFDMQSDFALAVGLDFLAEVSDQLLAPAEQSERFFRLILAVLEHLSAERADGLWAAVTYFSLWAVRLSGFLPELRVSRASLAVAEEMLQTPLSRLSPRTWTKDTVPDLRRFLLHRIEEHIERRLVTAPMLETL